MDLPDAGHGIAALLASAAPPCDYGRFDAPLVSFFNVKPRTRVERRAAMDREGLEKERLRSRRFGFNAYEDPGQLTVPSESTYTSSSARFSRDFAADERERKAAANARSQAGFARKREADLERDAARWAAMDAADAAEQERLAALRRDGSKARKNQGGLPFDVVAMSYHTTADGDGLRAHDDNLRARAATRAAVLERRAFSVGYDPLTNAGREYRAQVPAGAPLPVALAVVASAEQRDAEIAAASAAARARMGRNGLSEVAGLLGGGGGTSGAQQRAPAPGRPPSSASAPSASAVPYRGEALAGPLPAAYGSLATSARMALAGTGGGGAWGPR